MALEPKTLFTQKSPWVNSKGNNLNLCYLESIVVQNFRFVKESGSQDMQDMLCKDLRYRISQEKNVQDDELKSHRSFLASERDERVNTVQ
jgi:hypothetical protein